MVWQDISVDRMLTRAELTEALCSHFKVSADEIVIVKKIEDLLERNIDESIRISCITHVTKTKTQYPLMIHIILYDDSLRPDSDAFAVGKLCEFLKCRALISDDDIDTDPLNPCSWVLVKGDQDFEHIYITYEELEALDDMEEYELQ